VKKHHWIGTAIGLALLSTALVSCTARDNGSNQTRANAAADASTIEWKRDAEKQLVDAIAQAPANGLRPELFLQGDLPKDDAARQQALTRAALRYAEALAHGYADPKKLIDVYTIPRPGGDVRQGLAQAIQNGNVGAWLASLPPQTEEYKALSQAHLHYLQLAGTGNFEPVPQGKPIKSGSNDPRVAAVAAALRIAGYLDSAPAGPAPSAGKQQSAPANLSSHYSPQMVAAVKQLQSDFGFKPDGIVGGDTLDALNASPGYRARQTAIAMERLRWLERNPTGTRIDVNTASADLDFWRDGQHIDQRKVIVGEADKPTPQLQAPIFRLVANPTWTVPKGIGENELADKSQSWLQENNFVLKDGLYVQQSGPKNSLGLVKFDMDDEQAIYLHDTPAKALFAMSDRHRSHGCVRVENALQFAGAIAAQQGITDELQKALASKEESFVKLPNKIPVRLLYHTAYWDGREIQFRPDIYDWDTNVARALKLEPGRVIRQKQPESTDIGP
jgi:murein L,D-transpeptidase YcbB/YkuD